MCTFAHLKINPSMNETEFYEKLGLNISSIRSKKGLKQDDIANYLGMSRPSIVNIEKGNQRPSTYAILQIARFLNVEPSVLIPSLNGSRYEDVSYIGLDIDKSVFRDSNSNINAFIHSL